MSASRNGQGQQDDPVEIEWQFDALDLRPVERWLATLPSLSIETEEGGTVTALAKTPRRLTDSYLDTDDWRIAQAGFVVRTRRRGRHDEITLKDTRPATGNGLRQRLEVTEVLPPAGLGELGQEGPVGRRLRAIVGSRRLREVLQVRTRRRPFALRVGGVDTAEIALDDTVIVVGTGQRPMQLRRVEVEVQPEWLNILEPVVSQLRLACGLQPAGLSKFEAGLLALGQDIPGAPDLGSTAISEDSTIGELAYAVLRRHYAVLREKEPGTRLGEDIEELHDMRVAIRRLRAALALFADVLPVRAQAFHEELGWLGRVLGSVRDLDVQLVGLGDLAAEASGLALALPHLDQDPLAELATLLERDREKARTDMLDALDSVRWDRLAKGLAAMVQQGPARRSVATRVPAVVAMPDLIEHRHAAVVKAAKRAKKTGEVPDFHRVRIRCKRLRYSLEFSSEIYGGRTGRFVKQLTALQDELGRMQDAEVALLRLAELATGEDRLSPTTIFLMGGVAERYGREVTRLLRGLPKEIRRVRGNEWRDLSDLMARRRAAAEAALPPLRSTLRAVPRPSASLDEVSPSIVDHPSNAMISAGPPPRPPSTGATPSPAAPAGGQAAPGLSALPSPPPSTQGE